MIKKRHFLIAIACFFVFFLFMSIGPSESDGDTGTETLTTTKGWKYTITNHTDYDIVVVHEN